MSWSPWGVRCQPWVTAGLLRGVWGWGLVKDVAPTHTLRGTAGLQLGTDGPELASPCPRSGDMGTRGGCGQTAPVGPLGGQRTMWCVAAVPRSREGILELGATAAGGGPVRAPTLTTRLSR